MSAARILLIEDHTDVRESVATLLRSAGYEVVSASDGREGLALAQNERPDLLLTDLMLPWMNGYEICSMLKHDVRFQAIPVIIWSATKIQQEDTKLAIDAGADEFLLKTVNPRELLEKIQQLLDAAKRRASST